MALRSPQPQAPIDLLSVSVDLSLLDFFFFGLFWSFCLFRAASSAYGGSQTRGRIRTVAAGLHHSHSNEGSEPRLRPTPQLTATLDP